MRISDKALKFFGTIVIATVTLIAGIATAMLALQIPRTDKAIEDIATLMERSSSRGDTMTRLEEKIDRIDETTQTIARRLELAETDPLAVMATTGLMVEHGFKGAYVAGKVYLFPSSEAGVAALEKFGYLREQLSPVLTGYRTPEPALAPMKAPPREGR